MNLFVATAASVLLTVSAAGCSTPQAALNQSNGGAALTAALNAELKAFRSVQANIAELRIERVKSQEALIARYDADSAYDDRARRLAGASEQQTLYQALKELADSRAKDETDLQKLLADLDFTFLKLITVPPDPGGKLKATEESLAVMGSELSPRERIEMVSSFASTIKKSVDENKAKIDAAAASDGTSAPAPQPTVTPQKN